MAPNLSRALPVGCILLFAATSCQSYGRGEAVATLKAMEGGAPRWTDAGPSDPLRPVSTWRRVEDEAPPAPEHKANWQTFGLRAGGAALSNFNTQIRLDGRLIGEEVDFEDDLGFQSEAQIFRLDTFYRFNRRHRLDLSFYDIRRNSQRQVSREIDWGGQVIPIDSQVNAFIDTTILKFTYRYSFLASENWELGASFGFYGMGLNTGLSATLNGQDIIEPGEADFSVALPLPVIGLHAQWQFARDFWLRGSTELFWIQLEGLGDVEDLGGYLSDTMVSVEWDAFKNFGLGLGYNLFLMDLEVENSPRKLTLDYGYQGAIFYAKVGF